MLAFFQSLKLYLFTTLMLISVLLVFGISFLALTYFVMLPLSKCCPQVSSFVFSLSLLSLVVFLISLSKDIFFSCLKKRFKDFQLTPVQESWKNFLKLYGVTCLITTLGSSCVEYVVTFLEKGSFHSIQPSAFTIFCSVISDFLIGACFLNYWLRINNIKKRETNW